MGVEEGGTVKLINSEETDVKFDKPQCESDVELETFEAIRHRTR